MKEWKKRSVKKSITNQNTLEQFQLEPLSHNIDWTKFEDEENKIDRKQIAKIIVKELYELLKTESEDKKVDKSVINSGLVVILCLLTPLNKDLEDETRKYRVKDKEMMIDSLLNEEDSQFKKFVLKGLMNSSITMIRYYFRNFYSFLLDNLTNLNHKSEFLKLLVETILSNQEEDVHLLIDLAGNLFNEIVDLKKKDEAAVQALNLNFEQMFWEFFHKFENHISREKEFGDPVDFTLVSSLSFMEKVIKTDPEILEKMEESQKKVLVLNLLKKCLFNITSESVEYSSLKCKTPNSREAALNLLSCLCARDSKQTILIFLKGLSALSEHIPVPQTNSRSYSVMLEFEKRSSLGYSGIKNLGCICYMIAMLQQFFCTETFSRGILMANDYVPVEMTEVKTKQIDDNVFHQLQIMFGFLQDSHRREFNPTNFCLSYKDYDGQPINISVQQDAQEFLNMIFDKLERSLKKTPFKGILDSVYGGLKINVIECKGCGYIRTNEELYYNLSLNTKNLKNLDEGFNSMIQPEVISDFLCDNCKKKCDISKYCCLGTLPNVLIIQLNKIIFDLDFMAKIKVDLFYTKRFFNRKLF